MKEILFRGKRDDNDEWVYGNPIQIKKTKASFDTRLKETIQIIDCWVIGIQQYFPNNGLCYIYRSFEVKPETVNQYVGKIDINGVKIFEGDIVKTQKGVIQKVEYLEEFAVFACTNKKLEKPFQVSDTDEIIGNIYDEKGNDAI